MASPSNSWRNSPPVNLLFDHSVLAPRARWCSQVIIIRGLPEIVWVGIVAGYAPIEEDRSHARRGVVRGAVGADRAVDGGGRRGGPDGAAGGGSRGARAG